MFVKLRKSLLVLLSCLLAMGSTFSLGGAVQANSDDPNLKIPGWVIRAGEPLISLSDQVGNSTSLRFETQEGSTTDIVSVQLPLQAGKTYTVTAEVYMEKNVSHSFGWYLSSYDEQGKTLEEPAVRFASSEFTEGEWTKISFEQTLPSETHHARIRMYTGGVTTMIAYVDNVELFEHDGEGRLIRILVPNGDFEEKAEGPPGGGPGDEGDPGDEGGSGDAGEQPSEPEYAEQIENPYFEYFQVPGWFFEDPSGGPYITDERAYEGSKSLKFITFSGSNTDVRFNRMPAKGGATYEVHAKVFMEQNLNGNNSFNWYVISYDETGKQIESQRFGLGASTFEEGQWNDVNIEHQVPASAAAIQVRLYTGNPTIMTAYIDELQVFEVVGQTKTPVQLVNPGFEEPISLDHWEIEGGEVQVTSVDSYAGRYSLFVQKAAGQTITLTSNPVAVDSGTTYYASTQYKWLAGEEDGTLTIKFYDEEDQLLEQTTSLLAEKNNRQWTLGTTESVAPAGAIYATVELQYAGAGTYEALYDAVQLSNEPPEREPGESLYPETFINPSFEEPLADGSIPGWTILETHPDSSLVVTDRIANSGDNSLYFYDNSETAGLRIQSHPIAATGGYTYTASVEAWIIYQSHRIVLELEFYDRNGQQLHRETSLFNNLPTEVWTTLPVSANAPNGTAYVTVSFYSGGVSITEVYFDDVRIRETEPEEELEISHLGKPISLGQPVKVPLAQGGIIRTTAEGNNEVYMVSNGDPAVFHALNAETGELLFQRSLRQGDETVWAMAFAPNGDLYFASEGSGILYKYDPLAREMTEVGRIPVGDTKVWDLTATEDGMIFGGTYPGASVFAYDTINDEFRSYGRVHPVEQYVRGIAADENYIYAGIGSNKHLIRIDRETGEREELVIHSEEYPDDVTGQNGFYSDLWLMKDKILVQSGAGAIIVVNPETLEIEYKFDVSDRISPPSPYNDDLIYFKADEELYTYSFSENIATALEGLPPLPDTPRVKSLEWITLTQGPKAGRVVLAATTQYSEFFLYDPIDHEIEIVELEVEPQAVNIQSIEISPDNKLYVGGFQRGLAIIDPETDEVMKTFGIFRQAEGIGFKGNVAYFGTYTGAQIYRYDPSLPDNFGSTPDHNPGYVYKIEDEQDRPFAVTSGDHYVFIGSAPNYGVLGGSLAIYDERTDTWTAHRNVVENQSIIGLSYRDGLLYGGTSIWGGQGGSPSESEAKMFIWDPALGEKVDEFTLDIPDIDQAPKMIGALSFGPDGLLWGAIDGTIFAMDVNTKEIVKSKVILPSTYSSSKWNPFDLRWGPDGLLYTSLSRKLVVIDPETLQYRIFHELGTVHNMAVSASGDVYYADAASTLYKLPSLIEYPAPEPEPEPGPTVPVTPPAQPGSPPADAVQGLAELIEQVRKAAGNEQAMEEAIQQWLDDTLVLPVEALSVAEVAGSQWKVLDSSEVEERIAQLDAITDALQAVLDELEMSDSDVLANVRPRLTVETATEDSEMLGILLYAQELQQLDDVGLQLALFINNSHLELSPGAWIDEDAEAIGIQSSDVASTEVEAHLRKLALSETEYSSWTYLGTMVDVKVSTLQDGTFQEVNSLNARMQVTIPVFEQTEDGQGIVAAFKYNEHEARWEYVGGTMQDGVIVFEASTFGTYAIFQHYRTFEDVQGHWAQPMIEELAAMHIVEGMNDLHFEPEETLLRSQFVALMVRALQLDPVENEGTFTDVAKDDWYADAIETAYAAGLVNGHNGQFHPEQAITREEMAVMITAAFELMGKSLNVETPPFIDRDQISDWAMQAVDKAWTSGIIRGYTDGSFAPQATASRAEAITVIYRLLAL